MDNDQDHQCSNFTQSVAAEFDRLWAAVRDGEQRFLKRLEYQRRQDELVSVQLESVRDEIDDLAAWLSERFDQRLDSATGEAALARIDIDRVQDRLADLADQLNLRIAEVEVQLAAASPDVAAAVQTERLDELERAIDEFGALSASPLNGATAVPAPPPTAGTPADAGPNVDAVSDSMTRLLETVQPSAASASLGSVSPGTAHG